MGQTLSAPVTDKKTVWGENEKVAYAASSMQGWRVTMEDAHTIELQLEGDDEASFFAVYDGHGGAATAQYAGQNLHIRLAGDQAYKEGNYNQALKNAFLGTDEDIRADPDMVNDRSGATAVAALMKRGKLYVANAGDSRAVLCRNKVANAMSQDHKPTNEQELRRIVAANGFVEFGRVNGHLALSRAVGDFEFKSNAALRPEDQIVTANPDITEHEITPDCQFAILACDGIWDVLSSQAVVDLVSQKLSEGVTLPMVCEELMDHCLASNTQFGGLGCDNMTVILFVFKDNLTPNGVFLPSSAPPAATAAPEPAKDTKGEL